MARLFVTPRELDLISDLTKEVIKDVIGQKVFYYRAREDLSNVHPVYGEATSKVFDPPVEVEALVEWGEQQVKSDRFGVDVSNEVNVTLHQRDVLDKSLSVRTGDYFSYGPAFYEVAQVTKISKIFGQVEHTTGVKLHGKYARDGLISERPIGPLGEEFKDGDAVQTKFEQQRGQDNNSLGKTNDVRQLQKDGVLSAPVEGVRKVDTDSRSSSFYGDVN